MSVTGASGFSALSAARRSPQKRKNALAGRFEPGAGNSLGVLGAPEAALLLAFTARRGLAADGANDAALGGVAGGSEVGLVTATLPAPRFLPRKTFGLEGVGLAGLGSGPPASNEVLPGCTPRAVASCLSLGGLTLSFLLLYASALARAFAASCQHIKA